MNFWDFEMWQEILQFGYLAVIILVANTLIRKIKFLRNALLPVAVLGGFIALAIKQTGLVDSFMSDEFSSQITYHALMVGFVALGLRTKKEKAQTKASSPMKSGLFIVSNYLIQGAIGMGLTFLLISSFPASGLLLPMGYGQGPGQANNIGMQYETLGFSGGQSFGISIASFGYIWACIGGIGYLNYLVRKKGYKLGGTENNLVRTNFDIEDEGEIPLSQSIDKFTIQVCLVLLTCVLAYLLMYGITYVLGVTVGGNFVENTVKPLIWGFNFIFGTVAALFVSFVMKLLKKSKLMTHQYPNNYMLNRISGLAFDFMIVAAISSIDIGALSSLWVPLIVVTTAGGVATFFYNYKMCQRLFPEYPVEATMAFYGMLTGTVSTGMMLLREVDPYYQSPASDSLVVGSTTAVIFGFPVLLLVGIAPDVPLLCYALVVALFLVAFCCLFFWNKLFKRKSKTVLVEEDEAFEENKAE